MRYTVLLLLFFSCAGAHDMEPIVQFLPADSPVFNGTRAFTKHPYIFISDGCQLPRCSVEETLVHERVHFDRQAKDKMWLFKYTFDKDFRIDEEARAYAEEMKACIGAGHTDPEGALSNAVMDMSSGVYGDITRERAKKKIFEYYL